MCINYLLFDSSQKHLLYAIARNVKKRLLQLITNINTFSVFLLCSHISHSMNTYRTRRFVFLGQYKSHYKN